MKPQPASWSSLQSMESGCELLGAVRRVREWLLERL